jgi:transcription elongation factor Elf1
MTDEYDAIICPWCNDQDDDSWEYNMRDGDATVINCQICDQKMRVECSVTVLYSTSKIEEN